MYVYVYVSVSVYVYAAGNTQEAEEAHGTTAFQQHFSGQGDRMCPATSMRFPRVGLGEIYRKFHGFLSPIVGGFWKQIFPFNQPIEEWFA